MNTALHTLTKHWQVIDPLLRVPDTDEDYQKLIELLHQLIDEVGENESHPLASLLNFVGILLEDYEQQHYQKPEASVENVLAFLMQEHQLKQSDFLEIGSQGVVSEILNGKRQLNTRQIQALSKRFGVSPSVFF